MQWISVNKEYNSGYSSKSSNHLHTVNVKQILYYAEHKTVLNDDSKIKTVITMIDGSNLYVLESVDDITKMISNKVYK